MRLNWNSQASIRLASTEPFQRKIEGCLSGNGTFYDRRKDYWRNKDKLADVIIGIDKLAQAVMAPVAPRLRVPICRLRSQGAHRR